jgi:hypothetical protein
MLAIFTLQPHCDSSVEGGRPDDRRPSCQESRINELERLCFAGPGEAHRARQAQLAGRLIDVGCFHNAT